MKCEECGSEYVQRCARCYQRAFPPGDPQWGVSGGPASPLTEWVLKKATRQILTQAAVEAARRRIHGD